MEHQSKKDGFLSHLSFVNHETDKGKAESNLFMPQGESCCYHRHEQVVKDVEEMY